MEAAGDLAAGIQQLLAALFRDLADSPPVEEEVQAYLAAGIAEDDEGGDCDELVDSIAGFSPNFGRLAAAKQRQLVADLLAEAQRLRRAGASPAAAPARRPAASLASVAAEALSHLSSLSVGSGGSECGGSGSSGEEESAAAAVYSEEQRQALGTLRELCALPDACDAFLAHVLARKGGGSLEAAAAWLLECPDVVAAQTAWQQEREREREERRLATQEREETKKQIVSRFQLQAVSNGGGGIGKGKPATIKAWGGDENGGSGKCRYRDGMLVSSRGEKYIVEKGDDWDGGSRGKVYTKGKRGKGFM